MLQGGFSQTRLTKSTRLFFQDLFTLGSLLIITQTTCKKHCSNGESTSMCTQCKHCVDRFRLHRLIGQQQKGSAIHFHQVGLFLVRSRLFDSTWTRVSLLVIEAATDGCWSGLWTKSRTLLGQIWRKAWFIFGLHRHPWLRQHLCSSWPFSCRRLKGLCVWISELTLTHHGMAWHA